MRLLRQTYRAAKPEAPKPARDDISIKENVCPSTTGEARFRRPTMPTSTAADDDDRRVPLADITHLRRNAKKVTDGPVMLGSKAFHVCDL
ncbi:Aste57867_13438 [Aphanomyces stellatus]|uniref:Aste57867_13438 protein n=1 Tax=Aphanomyces stellatus TaxID=120398 RepID=A0A485KY50_9STRA|nr:hypothetical protein As57867_013388 [Aphanomyces stellatus]VFT90277.1 Aste57867_13438 [Aphanomyces stellatus]